MKQIKEGTYKGPAGQRVVVEWSDGPGWDTGSFMYRLWRSKVSYEVTREVWFMLQGWEKVK